MNYSYTCSNCGQENTVIVKVSVDKIRDEILKKLKPNMLNNLLEHSKNDKNKAFKKFVEISKRANTLDMRTKLCHLYFKDHYVYESKVFLHLLKMNTVKMDDYVEVVNGI
jgi:hypothetical protein